jgi:hypothetical protein
MYTILDYSDVTSCDAETARSQEWFGKVPRLGLAAERGGTQTVSGWFSHQELEVNMVEASWNGERDIAISCHFNPLQTF